jgi:TM2 domain-containing membrane protein YozV
METKVNNTPEEPYRAEILATAQLMQSNQKHGLPALLSLFIPGLGQTVKGQVGKGILIFIGTGIAYVMLIIHGLIIHIWQIADAYNNKSS